MQGFHPAAARAKAQNFADGGFVQSLKERVFGKPETVTEKYARQDAELMAKMAKKQAAPGAAPAQAPAPGNAIGGYVGMTALQRREKEAGLKDGGPVRGPGTGTSDSIHKKVPAGSYIMPADSTRQIGAPALAGMGDEVPVNLSNGEYEMPPAQVHAIGVQALNAMKGATHTPTGRMPAGNAPTGAGFKPELFFANGGLIEDKPRFQQPVPRAPQLLAAQSNAVNQTMAQNGRNPVALSTAAPASVSGASVTEAPMTASQARAFGFAPQGAPMTPPAATVAAGPAPTIPGMDMSEGRMTAEQARAFARDPGPGNANAGRAAPVAAPAATAAVATPAPVDAAPSMAQRASQGLRDFAGVGASAGESTGFMGKAARALGRTGAGAARLLGRVAAPLALAGEGIQVAKAATDPKASGLDVATQVAQGAGRLGAAGAGAGAGAALGTLGGPLAPVTVPLGGLVGGALGYFGADKAIEAGRTALGTDPRAPADRAPDLLASADAAPMPAAGQPAAQANPTDQRLAAGTVQPPAFAMAVPEAVTLNGQTGASVEGAPGVSKFRTADGRTLYSNVAGPDNDKLMSGQPGVQIAPGSGGGMAGVGAPGGASGFDPALSAARQAAAARGDFDAVQGSYFDQGQSFGGQTRESVQGDQLRQLALSPRGTPGRTAALALLRDQTAASATRQAHEATNKLAQQEFGLKREAAGFTTRAAQRLDAAQAKLEGAKTPEERDSAIETLRALQGKYEKELQNRFTVVPGGSEIDAGTGMAVTRPARVINNQTGEFVDSGAQAQQPLQNHIDALKKNPKLAAEFDGHYGAGAAAKILGTKQ